jgi:hypothetical protein
MCSSIVCPMFSRRRVCRNAHQRLLIRRGCHYGMRGGPNFRTELHALLAACEIISALPERIVARSSGLKFYTDVRSNRVPDRDLVNSLIALTFEEISSFERMLHGKPARASIIFKLPK